MFCQLLRQALVWGTLLLTFPARAQTWELLARTQPSGYSARGSQASFNNLAVAPNGDLVVSGLGGLRPLFAPVGTATDSALWPQGFVARFDSRTRQWAQLTDINALGGSAVTQLLVLPGGDVLVTGNYGRDAYGFPPRLTEGLQIRGQRLLSQVGAVDGFVARLDGSTGACRWLTQLETLTSASRALPACLALRTATEAIVVGAFAGQLQLGALAPLATATQPTSAALTDTDLVVARLDLATGQWLQAWQAGGPGQERASAVQLLPGGDVVLAGTAQGPVSLGGLPPLPGAPDLPQAFVARLDPLTAQWRWVRALRADAAANAADVALLPGGDLVFSGTYTGAASAGSLPLPRGLEAVSCFVARLDPAGQWQWASAGGSGRLNGSVDYELATTPAGQVLVAGSLSGRGRFGQLPVVQAGTVAGSNFDTFVAQLDGATGQWQWLTTVGTSYKTGLTNRDPGNLSGDIVALDNASFLVAGGFADGAYLGSSLGPLAASTTDGYVARLIVPLPCPATAPAGVYIALDSAVCAGTRTLQVNGAAFGSNYRWSTGAEGRALTVREPGAYTVTVHTPANCYYQLQATVTVPRQPTPPNIITPNGDTHNDRWQVPGLPANTAVRIYNRWGRLVYQADHYAHDWEAKGLADGLYYYVLTNDQLCAGPQLKGWVEVVR